MKLFYIPDGHRRYSDQEGVSLGASYNLGFKVLVEELIEPLFLKGGVTTLGIFLLSRLNLKRRDSEELAELLSTGEHLLAKLVARCQPLAHIRSHGTYLDQNIDVPSDAPRRLDLFIGSDVGDPSPIGEVDVFCRTGGELRLSGAPRALIGSYTQMYALDTLHSRLRYAEVDALLRNYHGRYMRETDATTTLDPVAGPVHA